MMTDEMIDSVNQGQEVLVPTSGWTLRVKKYPEDSGWKGWVEVETVEDDSGLQPYRTRVFGVPGVDEKIKEYEKIYANMKAQESESNWDIPWHRR